MISGIYIVPLHDGSAFKIGRSADVEKRIAGLTRHYYFDLTELWVLECDGASRQLVLESKMHSVLSDHRVLQEFEGGTEFYEIKYLQSAHRILTEISALDAVEFKKLKTFVSGINEFIFEWNESQRNLLTIGESIKRKRLLMNVTQDRLSMVSGVSKRTIERLEHGEGASLENGLMVLNALGINQFVPFMDDPEKQRAS